MNQPEQNSLVNCKECNDKGWQFFIEVMQQTPFGVQGGLARIPYEENVQIPAGALTLQPCTCSIGLRVAKIEDSRKES